MKKLTPQLIFLAGATLFTVTAKGQAPDQNINVTIRPPQTAEQRVADEVKLKELRKAAEARAAAEHATKIAETSPKAILARARIVFVQSDTQFFDSIQLQNALRKREEFDRWQMAIVDDWQKRDVADIIVEIDRPLFTYTFTYKITSRSTGILLATGKLTAFDGNIAAPKLAARVIEEMRIARGETKPKK